MVRRDDHIMVHMQSPQTTTSEQAQYNNNLPLTAAIIIISHVKATVLFKQYNVDVYSCTAPTEFARLNECYKWHDESAHL